MKQNPGLRTADMVSFDLSAIRHVDSPAGSFASPGGFNSIEACRLARYAGLGYKTSSFSICEYIPEKDFHDQTAMLGSHDGLVFSGRALPPQR